MLDSGYTSLSCALCLKYWQFGQNWCNQLVCHGIWLFKTGQGKTPVTTFFILFFMELDRWCFRRFHCFEKNEKHFSAQWKAKYWMILFLTFYHDENLRTGNKSCQIKLCDAIFTILVVVDYFCPSTARQTWLWQEFCMGCFHFYVPINPSTWSQLGRLQYCSIY